MKSYVQNIGLLLVSIICTNKLEAYTYGIVNHTQEKHKIEMILLFAGETWQNLGDVAPRSRIAYDFKLPRSGMCLRKIAVDGKEVKILTAGHKGYAEFLKRKNDAGEVSKWITLGLQEEYLGDNPGMFCGDQEFGLFQTNDGFIIVLNEYYNNYEKYKFY